MSENGGQNIYHAIYVDGDNCTGCTHCLKNCPTRAIRIRSGKAVIDQNRCIDCGECIRVCHANAVKVEQGALDSIFKYKYRVALVPAVLSGQFALDVTTDRIYAALLELGFTHVYEEEQTVEFQIQAIRRFQRESETRPIISSFCPAIVRLIQVRFPTLTDNLLLVKSLVDITAMTIINNFKELGIDASEIGIFYITPCPAKIVSIKSPVGDRESYVTDTLNLNMIYDLVSKRLHEDKNKPLPEDLCRRIHLSKSEIKWSLTGGEARYSSGRSLSIDGIANVIEFLEKVDDEAVDDIDFLELRACDQGCPGGILCPDNRFLAVEKLGVRASESASAEDGYLQKPTIDLKYSDILVPKVLPRQHLGLDENIKVALKKMEKIRKYTCYLPGFDCGACGAPNCHAFATDVVNKELTLSNCVFMQMNSGILSKIHGKNLVEKVWGKNRLQKDCTKKGVNNES